MNYHNITKDDMLNGDGLRVVLWVSGCTHHCEGCQNPITWDLAGGLPVLTTMKDFVKIPQNLCQKIIPVDIDLTISGEKKFFEIIGK